MQRLIDSSKSYVYSLSSKQQEILYLWTKCPKIFHKAIKLYSSMTKETSLEDRNLIESKYEIVRQLDDIFEKAPTLKSVQIDEDESKDSDSDNPKLYRSLVGSDDKGKIKSQIAGYTATTINELTDISSQYTCSILLQLQLDENIPVLFLDKVSHWSKEKEVLLPRNIQLNNLPENWQSTTCQVSLTMEKEKNDDHEDTFISKKNITFNAENIIATLSDVNKDFVKSVLIKLLGNKHSYAEELNMKRLAMYVRIWQIYNYGWGAMQDDTTLWRDGCINVISHMQTSQRQLKEILACIVDKIPHPRDVYPHPVNNYGFRTEGLPYFSTVSIYKTFESDLDNVHLSSIRDFVRYLNSLTSTPGVFNIMNEPLENPKEVINYKNYKIIQINHFPPIHTEIQFNNGVEIQ